MMSSFQDRQKSLFNHLKEAEDQYSFAKTNKATTDTDYGIIDKRTYKKLKHEMKQFRGRESIYKRSEASLKDCLRSKRIPDYMKNPQKWDYYSLSDVTPEQMSDSTNLATAHALIRELEEREEAKTKMHLDEENPEDDVFKKPTFKTSSTIKTDTKIDEPKAVFKSSKVVMPEYVVGVTQKKEKKIRKEQAKVTSESIKSSLKLDHLFDVEEEET